VDGAGKSTQLGLLADALRARGHGVLTTREPGGTALGERLRAVLLDRDAVSVGPSAEVLLFAAARAELVAEVIRPALDAGTWVVCDRFVDSSLAYQGVARGLGVDAVWDANRLAVEGCVPDMALVLDLEVDDAGARTGGDDRIEAEGDGFQRRVAEGYRELAARFPERVRLVSAAGSVDEVHEAVMSAVEPLL
jgi:dTMP kinase